MSKGVVILLVTAFFVPDLSQSYSAAQYVGDVPAKKHYTFDQLARFLNPVTSVSTSLDDLRAVLTPVLRRFRKRRDASSTIENPKGEDGNSINQEKKPRNESILGTILNYLKDFNSILKIPVALYNMTVTAARTRQKLQDIKEGIINGVTKKPDGAAGGNDARSSTTSSTTSSSPTSSSTTPNGGAESGGTGGDDDYYYDDDDDYDYRRKREAPKAKPGLAQPFDYELPDVAEYEELETSQEFEKRLESLNSDEMPTDVEDDPRVLLPPTDPNDPDGETIVIWESDLEENTSISDLEVSIVTPVTGILDTVNQIIDKSGAIVDLVGQYLRMFVGRSKRDTEEIIEVLDLRSYLKHKIDTLKYSILTTVSRIRKFLEKRLEEIAIVVSYSQQLLKSGAGVENHLERLRVKRTVEPVINAIQGITGQLLSKSKKLAEGYTKGVANVISTVWKLTLGRRKRSLDSYESYFDIIRQLLKSQMPLIAAIINTKSYATHMMFEPLWNFLEKAAPAVPDNKLDRKERSVTGNFVKGSRSKRENVAPKYLHVRKHPKFPEEARKRRNAHNVNGVVSASGNRIVKVSPRRRATAPP